MSQEGQENENVVQVAPEAIRTVTAIVQQAISGSSEELMSRMERLEEVMSHQQQQSAHMVRLEEAMSQQQQSAGGMLTSGGVSQDSEQWQHNVGHTPSGDGALPPSLHVMGLTSFSSPSGAVSTGNVGSWLGGVAAGFGAGVEPITAPSTAIVRRHTTDRIWQPNSNGDSHQHSGHLSLLSTNPWKDCGEDLVSQSECPSPS